MTESIDADRERWVLAADGPTGRFLWERFRLRPDFPLVAVWTPATDHPPAYNAYSPPVCTDLARVLDDPAISGMLIAVPRPSRGKLLQAALAANKRVLVEGDLGLAVKDAQEVLAAAEGRLGVFHLQRPDFDVLAAKAAVKSGRLGRIHSVRYVSCAAALDDSSPHGFPIDSSQERLHQETLRLFDTLQQILPGKPKVTAAWLCPRTAGFVTRLDYDEGSSAWIDLQRSSLCELATGWVLEGDLGAYHDRRIITRTNEGEIIREELRPDAEVDIDVMTDLKRLAHSLQTCRLSAIRAVQSAVIWDAVSSALQPEPPAHR